MIKDNIKNVLMNKHTYNCSSLDSGYKVILNHESCLMSNMDKYIKYLASISNVKCFDLELKLETKKR